MQGALATHVAADFFNTWMFATLDNIHCTGIRKVLLPLSLHCESLRNSPIKNRGEGLLIIKVIG